MKNRLRVGWVRRQIGKIHIHGYSQMTNIKDLAAKISTADDDNDRWGSEDAKAKYIRYRVYSSVYWGNQSPMAPGALQHAQGLELFNDGYEAGFRREIGQVAHYLPELENGFLSTYKETIFLRKVKIRRTASIGRRGWAFKAV
ncbi:hypothetical protein N7471_004403 [Penicillium samsonianum]|uniref:uncharacterized protein n=1 Tax=Penicillium samsonianum TaxID=1882272 RepID=UPI0025494BD2|nr:uncharacterized protein N7471_004403 [Penicillium samsonianum]KAJ6137917.1 hypothetical protein N7471_004403 [Penicillium samsonianum]